MSFELTGKYAKYKDDIMDFSALKTTTFSTEEIDKLWEKANSEDSMDEFITNVILNRYPPTDMLKSKYDLAEEYGYFTRHPEMRKYCNEKMPVWYVLDRMRKMDKYNCFNTDSERFLAFKEEFLYKTDIKEFKEYVYFIITDVYKGILNINKISPDFPIDRIAKKSGYFEKYPEMRRYISE